MARKRKIRAGKKRQASKASYTTLDNFIFNFLMVKPTYKRQKFRIFIKGAQVRLGKKVTKKKGKGPFATIVARRVTLQNQSWGCSAFRQKATGEKKRLQSLKAG